MTVAEGRTKNGKHRPIQVDNEGRIIYPDIEWGRIKGDLSKQTDLDDALSEKAHVTDIIQAYYGGSWNNHDGVVISTTVTDSGIATFDLTDDSIPLLSEIAGVFVTVNDESGLYTTGVPQINESLEFVTVAVNHRVFNGVQVLGIDVLGGTSVEPAPNGVEVQAIILGNRN